MSGTPLSFSVIITGGRSSGDRAETLRDVRAQFTSDTNFTNGINNAGRATVSGSGSWTLRALRITSFQTTDATTGVAISAIAAGNSFRVVIAMVNNSSGTLSGITANPSPPNVTKTGTFTGSTPSCSLTGTSPSPLNLAAGASGTITYTCTTITSNSGTVTYSVTNVRNSTNSATSQAASSNVLLVSPLSVSIAIKGPYAADTTCHFSADTATFEMTVTNNTTSSITSLTPSALTVFNTNTSVGAFSGPISTPNPCTPLAVGASCKFTWTAAVSITGTYPSTGAKPSFYVTGNATASPGPITSPTATSNTQDVDGFVISVSPSSTMADSGNTELTWSVMNRGCDNVNSVAITVPSGFTYSGDAYSAVTDTTGSGIPNENWGVSSTTFTAPLNNAPSADPGRLPTGSSGDFSLVFSQTPSTAGTYTFTINITDENAVSRTRTTDVTVTDPGSGIVAPSGWKEIFQ
jgi:hypothetical protein